MKPTYNYLFVLLLSLFFAVGCSEDDGGDDDNNVEPDKTELITAKAWKASDVTAATISLKSNSAYLDQLGIDSGIFVELIDNGVITFNQDGSYTLANSSTGNTSTGAWKLSTDEKQIILNEGTTNAITLDIVTLDATKFDSTTNQEIPGSPINPVKIDILLIPA